MAIANSDGSIVLSTKVDTSGMEQGTKSLKSQAAKLAAEYRKAGMSQSEAFKKAWSEIDRTKASTDKATDSTKKFGKQSQKSGEQAKVAFDGFKATLQSVARYLALAFSVTKIIQFSNEAGQLATQTEASVQRLIDIYGSASDSVGAFIDANAPALGRSNAAAASFSSVYGNLFSVWADQETNAKLTNRYLNMTAVVASKTGRTVEDVQERVRSGLLGNTEAIEDLGIFVNVKTIEMTDAFKRMANGKSWEQLDAYTQQQIRSMAILEQATAKYGNEVANTSATARSRLSAAYQDFKETWGRVINVILIPVIEKLTEIINYAIVAINLFSGRTGGILDGTKDTADNIGNAAENQENLNEEIKETNKELKKALAGFDEIQILTSGISENEVDNSVPDIQNKIDNIEPIGGAQDFEAKFNPMKIMQELKDALDYILPFIDAALVVIGLILLSAGNIPLGIGFIAAGAYLYSVTERSGDKVFDFNVIKKDLDVLSEYIEEVLVAIGIILLFLGQIPFGIGFILAGAIVYGVKEIKSSEYDEASLKEKLAVIGETVAVFLAVIGVILLMTGHIPLGLGFLFVGYKLFDVSEQVLDEGAINTKIKGFFEKNKELIVGVGVALLVIGVILMMFGVFTPRSLGILVAGSAILAAEEEINKGAVSENIKSFFEKNAEMITLLSSALLIIGILLLFVPHVLPLAIGLIAAGAVGLASEAALNWNAIVDTIKDFVTENQELTDLIFGSLVVIGLLTCLVNAPLGIALIASGAGGLIAKEEILNPGAVVEWVEKAWNKVKDFYNIYIAPAFEKLGDVFAFIFAPVEDIIELIKKAFKGIEDFLIKIGYIEDPAALEFEKRMKEFWNGGGEVVYPDAVRGTRIPNPLLYDATHKGTMWGTEDGGNLNTGYGIGRLNNENPLLLEERYYISEKEVMALVYKLVKDQERELGWSVIN